MRFLIKCAFWLGLVAFFLPFGTAGESRSDATISPNTLFFGAQQALADLTGFCDRAPAACQAGREAAHFAGQRIGEGLALAYGFVTDAGAPHGRSDGAFPPDAAPGGRDPFSVEVAGPPMPGPAAYTPPRPGAAQSAPAPLGEPAETLPQPAGSHTPIPTLAPRA